MEVIFIKTCFHLPGLPWSCSIIVGKEEDEGELFLPDWRKPGGEQPVPAGSVSVSSPCVHPATLRLTLPVGNHKRVSGPEQRLLCEASPYPLHALCQPFLNHSVRTVAVNDISPRPRGHRGKAKAGGELSLHTLNKNIINATLLFFLPFCTCWNKKIRLFLCTQKALFKSV